MRAGRAVLPVGRVRVRVHAVGQPGGRSDVVLVRVRVRWRDRARVRWRGRVTVRVRVRGRGRGRGRVTCTSCNTSRVGAEGAADSLTWWR